MTQVAERHGLYVAEFDRFRKERTGDPAWLRETRGRAIARFAELGFPTSRDEEWKFTSGALIAESAFGRAGTARVAPADLRPFAFDQVAPTEAVFVNGRYAPELSRIGGLPAGVEVSSLAAVLAERPALVEPYLGRIAAFDRQAFTALNTGFMEDGAFVWMPRGVALDAPIHLLFVAAGHDGATVSHPRVLIVAGENSQARIIESYAGPSGQTYFTNAVTEIALGPHTVVDHYKVQRESLAGFHMGSMAVRGERRSTFSSHSISLGGAWVRNEVMAMLDGEGIDCTLNGLYVADANRLIDNHTTIDHAKAHCGSHEVYKGILGGRARAVFNGKIIVRPDAQKTDAKQTNKALLLSDDAQINTKPQLEIFANDVKCTHGAAVGQLDEDAIFYLRTRGLSLEEARRLLIQAFAGDILNRVKVEPLRDQLERAMLAQLPAEARGKGAA